MRTPPLVDGVPKLLLTPEEAAQALGIGRSHVYELLRTGRLKSVQIGTCRRIPLAALDEFVVELQRLDT
jgi:excisionase family DNA binding protein